MNLLAARLLRWLFLPRQAWVAFLLCAVTASAIGVVHSSHLTRSSYAELQKLAREHDDLEYEYERLLLESGAWAGYTRLDRVAQRDLAMVAPRPHEIKVVK